MAKDRPILFKPDMVNAIQAGRKTQTRRALRLQPIDILPMNVPNEWATLQTRDPNHGNVIRCRFGVPGDRLWVREMWAYWGSLETPANVIYRADGDKSATRWRPSIHMPRWASRLTLEVTEVRAERLQAITDEEICLELGAPLRWEAEGPEPYRRDLRGSFAVLWDAIHTKLHRWSDNPWVWVIAFNLQNSSN